MAKKDDMRNKLVEIRAALANWHGLIERKAETCDISEIGECMLHTERGQGWQSGQGYQLAHVSGTRRQTGPLNKIQGGYEHGT